MMTNRVRGEAPVMLGGESFTLCLTLGALAEIESGLDVTSLLELDERLAQLRAGDLILILAALLRGGGHDISRQDLAARPINMHDVVRAIEHAFQMALTPPRGAEDTQTMPGKN